MAKLTNILTADLAIPLAVETKFPMLPKLSKQLTTIAGKVPAGPDLPGMVVTVLEPPPPNKTGQPLATFFSGTPFTGPVSSALPPRPIVIPLPARPVTITGLEVQIPANTAKQVRPVYTGTGF